MESDPYWNGIAVALSRAGHEDIISRFNQVETMIRDGLADYSA